MKMHQMNTGAVEWALFHTLVVSSTRSNVNTNAASTGVLPLPTGCHVRRSSFF